MTLLPEKTIFVFCCIRNKLPLHYKTIVCTVIDSTLQFNLKKKVYKGFMFSELALLYRRLITKASNSFEGFFRMY